MATIGNKFIDFVDLYKAQTGSGQIIPVIEALHTLNPIMEDSVMVECNDGANHKHAVRTALPDAAWGRMYQGVPRSKGITQQIQDATGFVESSCEVDTRLLKAQPNAAAYRASQAEAHLETIAQEVQRVYFYGDARLEPDKFHGLSPRYSTLANPTVVNGGGSGSDNMSMWFVTHGVGKTQLIYPKGTMGGISREDKGEHPAVDVNGNTYFAKIEEFRQHVGLAIGDARWNARICNIDVSAALAGSVNLFGLLRSAYYKMQRRRNMNIKNGGMVSPGNTVIYMNRTALEVLDLLGTNAGASDNFVRLVPKEIEGREVMTWRGIPIRETDGLVNNEALVA